jgi:hypothetical protein
MASLFANDEPQSEAAADFDTKVRQFLHRWSWRTDLAVVRRELDALIADAVSESRLSPAVGRRTLGDEQTQDRGAGNPDPERVA